MSARRLVCALGLLLVPFLARAQGLGDVAAREKVKREKDARTAKAQAPAYTNADLEAGQPEGAKKGDGAAAAGGAAAEPSAAEQAAQPESREGRSADRDRQGRDQAVKAAQEALVAAEARVQELRNKLNPMSTSFIYGPTGSNSAEEEARVTAELKEAEQAVEAARGALEAARTAASAGGGEAPR